MIRNFAQSYQPPSSSQVGVQQVMVMEFGRLIQLLMEQNSLSQGLDINNTTHPFWLDRILWPEKNGIHGIMPLMCSERKEHLTYTCKRNMLSIDGMHYCMGSIGNRIFAVTACLLSCVYNEKEGDDKKLRSCEEKCNEQYMSLEPINDSMWNTKLA